LIGEKDIDLRQAVELIKAEKPEMGKNIDIVEPYKKEYQITEEKIKDLTHRLKRERVYTWYLFSISWIFWAIWSTRISELAVFCSSSAASTW